MAERDNDEFDDEALNRALDGAFDAAGREADDESLVAPSVLERVREIAGKAPGISLGESPADAGRPTSADAGKYVVLDQLGKGAVGVVHRGRDQDLGRDVAIKFLNDKYRDHQSILYRFVEEAQIGGQLQHPGIVPVYDLGLSGDRPFFTMKLIEGETLAKLLAARESPASERRRFLAIFEQVCQTVAYAHRQGVVHRDLKPSNVMIGAFGEVQVVDWGMGKVLSAGTPANAERCDVPVDDQYASQVATVRTGRDETRSVLGGRHGHTGLHAARASDGAGGPARRAQRRLRARRDPL